MILALKLLVVFIVFGAMVWFLVVNVRADVQDLLKRRR